MLFSKKKIQQKVVQEGLVIGEYCTLSELGSLPIDGAIALFTSGQLGPKINRGFTELFFVLEGKLEIEMDNRRVVLEKEDLFIMPKDRVHTLYGYNAKIFIVCSPPFDPNNMEFV